MRSSRVSVFAMDDAYIVLYIRALPCVRRAQEARLQSLAMQLAESDCTLRVTNTHLCSADSARAKEK